MNLLSWSFDPILLLGVAAAATLYARGWTRGRLPRWRKLCFVTGLALVVIALESPIGTYDEELFVLHMTEHMLLLVGAAPLLLLGAPMVPILWGLPEQERRGVTRLFRPRGHLGRLGAVLSHPLVALPLFMTTFAAWHIPALYDAAQARSLVHYAEHATFFATALLFWWPVVHPSGGVRRLPRVASVLYFAPPMIEGTIIGALLTFATRPVYLTYVQAPRLTGLSVVDDQQLAGLVMWISSGLVFAIAIACDVAAALREEKQAFDGATSRQRALGSRAPLTGSEC